LAPADQRRADGRRVLSPGSRGTCAAPSPARPIRSASRCGRDEGVPLRRTGTPRPRRHPSAARPALAGRLQLVAGT